MTENELKKTVFDTGMKIHTYFKNGVKHVINKQL
jgi:hypothetical protein